MDLPRIPIAPEEAQFLVVSKRFPTLTYLFQTPEQVIEWFLSPGRSMEDYLVRKLEPCEFC